jgi:uncharacterized RDD family membrane protein YckC
MSSEKSVLPQNTPLPATVLRRLGAIFYDMLLLLSIWVIAAFLAQPWVDGQATIAYQLYLLAVSFLYFSWCWLHGGQTLGMLAWKIQLATLDDTPLTLKHAVLRFLAIVISWLIFSLGLFWLIRYHQTSVAMIIWLVGLSGFLWSLIDQQRRNGYDWASGTRVVLKLR